MAVKGGIVGLPNAQVNTFNALNEAGIAAENYHSARSSTQRRHCEVPDPRLRALAAIAKPIKSYRRVEFVDIAGLVAGASKGEGSAISSLPTSRMRRDRDIVRASRSECRARSGRIDPISDIEVDQPELALADLATADKQLAKYSKVARAVTQSAEVKEAKRLVDALEKVLPTLNQAQPVRSIDLSAEERATIRPLFLLTSKPTMYVANVEEHGFDNNPLLDVVRAHAVKEGAPVVAVCAKIEAEIADLSEDDMAVFLADMGMTEPGLNRVIRAGYTLLGLFTYFTAGPKEVRAWTVTAGSTAPQAAA